MIVMVKINNVRKFYADGVAHRNKELYQEMEALDPYPYKDEAYLRRLRHSCRGAQQVLKEEGLVRVKRSTWQM